MDIDLRPSLLKSFRLWESIQDLYQSDFLTSFDTGPPLLAPPACSINVDLEVRLKILNSARTEFDVNQTKNQCQTSHKVILKGLNSKPPLKKKSKHLRAEKSAI